jgi:hypothetical protein
MRPDGGLKKKKKKKKKGERESARVCACVRACPENEYFS